MKPLPTGSTIGIFGGGQLAKMLIFDAHRLGYRVIAVDPDKDCPAAAVADDFIVSELGDLGGAMNLARRSDVITADTEHVPASVLQAVEPLVRVRPASSVLMRIQDRLTQRRFLSAQGLPQPRHEPCDSELTLAEAAHRIGYPCILKTRLAGYDGKGQVRINSQAEIRQAWRAIGRQAAVLEQFVDFELEVSVVLARDETGNCRVYPVAENHHKRGILHTTHVPARISQTHCSLATELAIRTAQALEIVGVMALELFLTRKGQLLINEIAPRTHNSGHFTLGGCRTSQFEQHVRAICGLPLGDPSPHSPSVMLNLLGDLWVAGEPQWSSILENTGARLHLYGKRVPRPGRKMGHILFQNSNLEAASDMAACVAERLKESIANRGVPQAWS